MGSLSVSIQMEHPVSALLPPPPPPPPPKMKQKKKKKILLLQETATYLCCYCPSLCLLVCLHSRSTCVHCGPLHERRRRYVSFFPVYKFAVLCVQVQCLMMLRMYVSCTTFAAYFGSYLMRTVRSSSTLACTHFKTSPIVHTSPVLLDPYFAPIKCSDCGSVTTGPQILPCLIIRAPWSAGFSIVPELPCSKTAPHPAMSLLTAQCRLPRQLPSVYATMESGCRYRSCCGISPCAVGFKPFAYREGLYLVPVASHHAASSLACVPQLPMSIPEISMYLNTVSAHTANLEHDLGHGTQHKISLRGSLLNGILSNSSDLVARVAVGVILRNTVKHCRHINTHAGPPGS